ncbi:hypothetical protein [Reichenbachiella ulvae]|uniref:Peptidase S54 rhomboid domain-containing protein n=1 Tax=Reichenbachiella ulvae TaxID=2980104 RepID=A0ABT3CU80_9BACT|nr:hypothetical protein [Reichenbachiella ulvae]MCV9387251.1 hypothetical protein [Reichenbachiella ulvae]
MKNHTSEQLIPFQWFWTDTHGQKMSFIEWFKSRPFSIIYFTFIWSIVGILGFASTRNCDDSWQHAFACDRAIWMGKMISNPIAYFFSWFTAPFFHNGIDHIFFVTIFGILLTIQSLEVQYGYKKALVVFFGSYVFVGVFFGLFFNVGLYLWPHIEFFSFGFERNWMGGSVGLYSAAGALTYDSRKKWAIPLIIASFETLNLTVIGIDIHISFIHVMSAISGYLTFWSLNRK